MSRFVTPLNVTQIGLERWRLEAQLVYESELLKRHIAVPAGFITDFASVPRYLPVAYMLFGGKANAAGALHDWLYSTQMLTRKQADAILFEAIVALGHSRATAYTMWAGVRLGGWLYWNKPNVPQKPHIEEAMEDAA